VLPSTGMFTSDGALLVFSNDLMLKLSISILCAYDTYEYPFWKVNANYLSGLVLPPSFKSLL